MSDEPTERDVEALAKELRQSRLSWGTHADRWLDSEWQETFWRDVAQTASDWHAERIAQARREGAAEVTARAEALADEWEHVGGGDPVGSAFADGYNAAMRAQAETLRAALRGDA